ncbi:hypothetical protein SpCBS45565_g06935 [Spizellomyces sp. 'palustris']|nr:hypothetical protein SpCBS45565_g06935 [Spizellomyces sp. 'palustris']
MPRKEFQQDVSKLLKLQQAFNESPYLRGLARGDEDGMLVFRFHYAGRHSVEVSLVFSDLHTYPEECSGFCFLDDSHADFRAAGAAEAVANVPISRQSIFQCFESCILRLCDIFKTPSGPLLKILAKGAEAPDSDDLVELGDVETCETDSSDDDFNYRSDLDDSMSAICGISDRMRGLLLRDVNELISCGYIHQGFLNYPAENGFILYTSILIQELVNSGILTQDQCLAWNLEPSKYMFMLMKFGPEYIEVLQKDNISYIRGMDTDPTAAFHTQPLVEFRVVTGDVPSLSATDGISMFQANSANNHQLRLQNTTRRETRRAILSPFFLSWSLADILNRRFLMLLSYRLQFGLNWAGTEFTYEKRNAIAGNQPDPCFPFGDPHTGSADWNLCRFADAQELTFIQQYRHADQLNSLFADPADKFEPLKPFVCDSALCTYQYFDLGLGASIEQEIMHHPGVVDMLVSLAYVAATNQKLDPFPHGVGYTKFAVHPNVGQILLRDGNFLSVRYELHSHVRVAVGDMIEYCYQGQIFRVKVLAINDRLEISDELPIINGKSASFFQDQRIPFKIIQNLWIGWPIVQTGAVGQHEHNLVVQTLDRLPPIKDLQNALNQQLVTGWMQSKWSHHTEAQEEDCMNVDVLDRETETKRQKTPKGSLTKQSPSWIISSNRSYVRELVDDKEKVAGVGVGYWQFKMVMSNPDKEERFLKEQRALTARKASEMASQNYEEHSGDQQFTREVDGATYVPMDVNYTPSDGYQRPIRIPLSSAIAPVPETSEHNFVDPGLLQLAKEEEARTRRSVETAVVLHGEDDMVNFNAFAPSKQPK